MRIKDRHLGLLYYTFLVCIVGYIVGYVLLYKQSYLQQSPAQGITRLDVRP